MSFRNRPVLDRKHRPRWQDELRTQRLLVAGFALAIAAAIGIFAATAWFDYYQGHLRPVAAVGEVSYNVDDLSGRISIIGSELQARYLDLQSQLGGVRDGAIQQGQKAIDDALSSLLSTAGDSLVLSRVLTVAAAHYGIRVSNAELDAEVTRRQTLTERLKLSLIVVHALPKDAKPGTEPTAADWTRAEGEISDIVEQIRGGADFAATAKEKSLDPSGPDGGVLGWVQTGDPSFEAYFNEAHAAAIGDLVGPIKDGNGYHLLRLDARQSAGPDQRLKRLLASAGVSDTKYRAYVYGELLTSAFHDYFSTKVMIRYQPQREVSQIFISAQQDAPVPQQRLRHFLAQPIPGQQDQSAATDAQWAAALARAEAFRIEASKPDADWFALAETSDDTITGSRGGDLGWYDPASSNYVAEFKTGVVGLAVGEISQPVKTPFGYHVIEVTAIRTRPSEQAQSLVTTLRQHPDQFAKLAGEQSDDASTAPKGGDLGWVIRYQLDTLLSDRIFDMTTPEQISDVVETDSGFYIFKLTDSSPMRYVPSATLEQVRQDGFNRWLTEIRDGAHTWVDPQFGAAPTTG